MNQSELMDLHGRMCDEARQIMRRKNDDYADPGKGDVFGNLNACEQLGICSTEQGILIRMLDKVKRLVTASTRDLQVGDESAADTRRDLINYVVLLEAKAMQRVGDGEIVSQESKRGDLDKKTQLMLRFRIWQDPDTGRWVIMDRASGSCCGSWDTFAQAHKDRSRIITEHLVAEQSGAGDTSGPDAPENAESVTVTTDTSDETLEAMPTDEEWRRRDFELCKAVGQVKDEREYDLRRRFVVRFRPSDGLFEVRDEAAGKCLGIFSTRQEAWAEQDRIIQKHAKCASGERDMSHLSAFPESGEDAQDAHDSGPDETVRRTDTSDETDDSTAPTSVLAIRLSNGAYQLVERESRRIVSTHGSYAEALQAIEAGKQSVPSAEQGDADEPEQQQRPRPEDDQSDDD